MSHLTSGSATAASRRAILHVDMDAFFASVEQREHPELAGRPVVVGADPRGGKGRGVVAACSYQARAFGIHSALPISRAYQLCPEAVFLRPSGGLYGRVSQQVMAILRRFTDLVEPISIDEAFLDVTGSRRLFGSPLAIARSIKKSIAREQRLTCSVGLAVNKFLAKIASDLEKPDGLCVVPPGREKQFLQDLPVGRVWGVGPRTEARLRRLGVRTIGQIASLSCRYWEHQLGRQGACLWRLSLGMDERPVKPVSGFQSLSHESTFASDTRNLALIRKRLLSLSEGVARRARAHGVIGRTITLKWRLADFTTLTRQQTLTEGTSGAGVIYQVVCRLMDRLLPLQQDVRLVGVGISQLRPRVRGQKELFAGAGKDRPGLDASLDRITRRFGSKAIQKASLLEDSAAAGEAVSSFLKR